MSVQVSIDQQLKLALYKFANNNNASRFCHSSNE